jgi:hypothetical protein
LAAIDKPVGDILRDKDALAPLQELQSAVLSLLEEPRGIGRPNETGDLWEVVNCLARAWRKATGKPFTSRWLRRGFEPLSDGCRFVHAIVAHIDADRLSQLPTVTRNVIEEHNMRKRGGF